MAFLPVETVIREQQDAYYAALAAADQAAEATPFVEFMLAAIFEALLEACATDQVTDQVAALLKVLPAGVTLKTNELMQRLGLSHRPTFSKSYLKPALATGLIEMTEPSSPRSPTQQYRRVRSQR